MHVLHHKIVNLEVLRPLNTLDEKTVLNGYLVFEIFVYRRIFEGQFFWRAFLLTKPQRLQKFCAHVRPLVNFEL